MSDLPDIYVELIAIEKSSTGEGRVPMLLVDAAVATAGAAHQCPGATELPMTTE
jgi:hypothetical protein